MNKVYQRIIWENFPSERTALNESNLNRMDLALDNIDNRVIEMDATKVNVETANTLIRNWTIDEETGVITVEKLNGEKIIFDLNIEKIPVNFELSADGILTMTTDGGTQYTANIGAMIPVLTFEDSNEIAVSVTGTGVNKTYSFSIKSGSVTEDKLQPNFLADVKTEVAKAQASRYAAAQSAEDASTSATAAAESETNAKTSETSASESASAAADSEKNAKASAEGAASSAQSASGSAASALEYANSANGSADTASAKAAESSESSASASDSATSASTSASSAEDSATAASSSATLAESYTHGGTGTREGEDADNARYYMEQAKEVSAVGIMTAENAGIGKPDGKTITADPDGTLRVGVMTSKNAGIGMPDGETIIVDGNGVFGANVNKDLLDKLGESESGNLMFGGKEIGSSQTADSPTKTVFNDDNSITEYFANQNIKTTVFNDDESITETLKDPDGNVIATKTTTFNPDGSIDEEVS